MKNIEKKKIIMIVIAVISGLFFASFILYQRSGTFGQTEIISISLTAVIAVIIPIIIFRKMKN